jgi:hypothetical protein
MSFRFIVDQKRIEADLELIREQMKEKTSELNQIEGLKDNVEPFRLKPANLDELNLHTYKTMY